MSTVRALPTGLRGFDCNRALSAEEAQKFAAAGYRFALRYVPRTLRHTEDLSLGEVSRLHAQGLAVMPVQHVESESSWLPTDDKGRSYGAAAAAAASACGIAPGTSVWLDLEGVTPGTNSEQIIRYCNYWHDKVAAAGYLPGLYVGWHAGLTPAQLYQRLKFTRYWAAYNLNADEYPATRGICLRQGAAKPGDRPLGIGFELDIDLSRTDLLGDAAMVHAPDEWAV